MLLIFHPQSRMKTARVSSVLFHRIVSFLVRCDQLIIINFIFTAARIVYICHLYASSHIWTHSTTDLCILFFFPSSRFSLSVQILSSVVVVVVGEIKHNSMTNFPLTANEMKVNKSAQSSHTHRYTNISPPNK